MGMEAGVNNGKNFGPGAAVSLPEYFPLISTCYETQEGYRFTSTALRPLYIVLIKLNNLSKGHTWIKCVHLDTPPFTLSIYTLIS